MPREIYWHRIFKKAVSNFSWKAVTEKTELKKKETKVKWSARLKEILTSITQKSGSTLFQKNTERNYNKWLKSYVEHEVLTSSNQSSKIKVSVRSKNEATNSVDKFGHTKGTSNMQSKVTCS